MCIQQLCVLRFLTGYYSIPNPVYVWMQNIKYLQLKPSHHFPFMHVFSTVQWVFKVITLVAWTNVNTSKMHLRARLHILFTHTFLHFVSIWKNWHWFIEIYCYLWSNICSLEVRYWQHWVVGYAGCTFFGHFWQTNFCENFG